MSHTIKLLRNPHFWIILVIFLICIVLHYPQQAPFLKELGLSSLFGLSRHAIERILFLFPIIYAGFAFGVRGGAVTLVAALAAMLPRVIFISPHPMDALFEVCAVIAAGALANWWLEARRREIGRREQALLKLEALRHELESHMKLIQESEEGLSVLHTISTAVNRSLDLEEVANAAADKVMEVMDIDGVLLFVLEEGAEELELKGYRGVSEEFARGAGRLKLREGFNRWLAQTGEPLFVEDSPLASALSQEGVIVKGIESIFIVPLKSRDKAVGALCTIMRRPKQLTSEEKELLALIATELGIAIEKAYLYRESRLAMRRFRELFENAHDAMWVHDAEGNIVDANRACEKLTGYAPEELIGMNVTRFLNEKSLSLAREVRRRLLSGEGIEQPYEQRMIRKDGAESIIMLATSVLGDKEIPQAFQNIARDITEERRLQENLRLYTSQISKAHEEERNRIARELHDDTIQTMVAVSRDLDSLISKDSGIPRERLKHLEELQKAIDESLIRTRRFIQDLRPPTLEYLGLFPALRELVAQMQEQPSIEVNLKTKGSERHFTPEEKLLIYRIIQEALRNIWKHSEATKAEVVIKLGEERNTVTINDNGKGFNAEESLGFLETGKLGLAGMKERAHLLGGTLTIHSKLDSGTTIILDILR